MEMSLNNLMAVLASILLAGLASVGIASIFDNNPDKDPLPLRPLFLKSLIAGCILLGCLGFFKKELVLGLGMVVTAEILWFMMSGRQRHPIID